VNFLIRGALGALLFCLATALPAVAQTADPSPAEGPVVAFEAAVDGHDAARAVAALSDTAVLLGADSATGREQIKAWVEDQIDHGIVLEVGQLQVNGSRVTWTARVSRSDWVVDGEGVRYFDQEAAVSGGKITVLGTHFRPGGSPAPQDINFVRASTLVAAPGRVSGGRWQGGLIAAALVLGLGLLSGLYAASGFSDRATTPSHQKGKLVTSLGRAAQLRRPPELT
jgi:hypothetical protein